MSTGRITLQLRTVDSDRVVFGARVPVDPPEGEAPLPSYGAMFRPPLDGHQVGVETWLRREDWEQRGAPLVLVLDVRSAEQGIEQ